MTTTSHKEVILVISTTNGPNITFQKANNRSKVVQVHFIAMEWGFFDFWKAVCSAIWNCAMLMVPNVTLNFVVVCPWSGNFCQKSWKCHFTKKQSYKRPQEKGELQHTESVLLSYLLKVQIKTKFSSSKRWWQSQTLTNSVWSGSVSELKPGLSASADQTW